MRLEHIPLILGVIVALIGLGFIADASMAANAPPSPERRRRTRAEPSRAGEAVVGVGTLCMAAALLGRDTWRYGTLSVLLGAALLLIGVVLNRAFLKEALLFRGPARRAEGGTEGGAGKAVRPVARPQGARPAAPTPAVPETPRQPAKPRQEPRSREASAPGASPEAAQRNHSTGAATPGRHPTPLGSPVYRPAPKAADASPPVPPAAPTPPPQQPPGPQERRKTPRGKR